MTTSSDPRIEAYLRRQGLRSFTTQKSFWRWAQKKIGNKNVERLVQSMEQRASGDTKGAKSFYDFLVNPDIEHVAASFEYHLLIKIVHWTLPRLPRTGTIVELGCHSGLLTRYYALARPEAVVIGIDYSAQAIKEARRQAAKQAIDNVTFEVMDLTEPNPLSIPQVDCILTGRVLGELMTMIRRKRASWKDYTFLPSSTEIDPDARRALQTCKGVSRDGGKLLITERLSDYDRLERLWMLTQEAGFDPQLESVAPIEWQDVAGKHSTWFFAATDGTAQTVKPLPVAAIPITSRSIEALNSPTRLMIDGILAWQSWQALTNREIDEGQTFTWPGGEQIHFEIGTTGADAGYAYISSNTDIHLLTLFMPQEREAVLRDLHEYADQLRETGAT